MHYRDFLKENQGNCDKIWKIIYELANIKTKSRTDSNELITEDGKILASADEIAEGLNEHFANIGPKMAELISLLMIAFACHVINSAKTLSF